MHGIGISVYSVKMEIYKPITSRASRCSNASVSFPAMVTSVVDVTLSSDDASSTSTDVNPHTGKWQFPGGKPLKKDKPEFWRAHVLGSEIAEVDREQFSTKSEDVPTALWEQYKNTLQYRHPVLEVLPPRRGT